MVVSTTPISIVTETTDAYGTLAVAATERKNM